MENLKKVDFVVIGAHADDAELGCGGTIARMVSQGYSGLIVDMTCATAATRGTPEERLQEAARAAQILQVERVNLGFEDAGLENSPETQKSLIEIFRKCQPQMVFTHWHQDLHPDHKVCHHLVQDAWYKAGLRALYSEWPAFRPPRLFYFMGGVEFEPDFCVDTSAFWDTRVEALKAYQSQFYSDQPEGQVRSEPASQISGKDFAEYVDIRSKALGNRIRTQRAEGFKMKETPQIENLMQLSTQPWR